MIQFNKIFIQLENQGIVNHYVGIDWSQGGSSTGENHLVSSATGFGPGHDEDAKSGGQQVQEWETVWASLG